MFPIRQRHFKELRIDEEMFFDSVAYWRRDKGGLDDVRGTFFGTCLARLMGYAGRRFWKLFGKCLGRRKLEHICLDLNTCFET